jgi:hypothetical protein
MCKFFRREKANHHFPELCRKFRLPGFLVSTAKSTALPLALLSLIAVFGFGYLNLTNSTATVGYRIKVMEKELASLQLENKQLRLDYIESQSMAKITEKTAKLELVPQGKIEIINITEPQIALK